MRNIFTKSLAAVSLSAAALALPTVASAGEYRKCKDTEAAIAGAIIGGIIGAVIGEGANDCEKDGRIYRNVRAIGSYQSISAHQPAYQTVQYRGNNRGYNDRNRQTSYGYSSRQYDRDLRRIDRRIDRLRNERRELKQRQRYERRSRWIQRRLNEISHELDHLKNERRRVKRAYDNRRDLRDYRPRNRRGHYHGQTVCYSDH